VLQPVCLSACLSVCPYVCHGLLTKEWETVRKFQVSKNIPYGICDWLYRFQIKRSKQASTNAGHRVLAQFEGEKSTLTDLCLIACAHNSKMNNVEKFEFNAQVSNSTSITRNVISSVKVKVTMFTKLRRKMHHK